MSLSVLISIIIAAPLLYALVGILHTKLYFALRPSHYNKKDGYNHLTAKWDMVPNVGFIWVVGVLWPVMLLWTIATIVYLVLAPVGRTSAKLTNTMISSAITGTVPVRSSVASSVKNFVAPKALEKE